MKKQALLYSFLFFFITTAFAQKKLPVQLLGNWLSPKNNEWKFGFTKNYAVADGSFWTYQIKSQTGNNIILLLDNQKVQREVYITLTADSNIKIGYSKTSRQQCTKKWNDQPDYACYDTTGFTSPLLKTAGFHLSGVLNGYKKSLDNYQYINICFIQLGGSSQKIYPVMVDSLGRFNLEFPLMNPQEIKITFGNELVELYAVPGSSVMTNINLNRAKLATMEDFLTYITSRPAVLYMGKEALLNTEMNDYSYQLRKVFNFKDNEDQKNALDQQKYKAYRLDKMKEMSQNLSGYTLKHHSSKKFTQYYQYAIKYGAAYDLTSYNWTNKSKLTLDYLSFVKQLPINDTLSVITEKYPSLLQNISSMDHYEGLLYRSPSIEEVIASTKENGYKFTPDEEAYAIKNISYHLKGQDTIDTKQPNGIEISHENELKALWGGVWQSIGLQRQENKQRLEGFLGIQKASLSNSILVATAAYEKISQANGLEEKEWLKTTEGIKTSELFTVLAAYNNELLAKASGALPQQAKVIDPLKSEQDKVLENLLGKYKGKAVYVDFWAPWCGPCMNEMPKSKTLRKEMEGKDIVFLYLGVSCTEDSWKKAIKVNEIEGEHYLLNADEYSLLKGKFQITGIPRYMLIGKDGKIANNDAKRPDDSIQLKQDIDALLK